MFNVEIDSVSSEVRGIEFQSLHFSTDIFGGKAWRSSKRDSEGTFVILMERNKAINNVLFCINRIIIELNNERAVDFATFGLGGTEFVGVTFAEDSRDKSTMIEGIGIDNKTEAILGGCRRRSSDGEGFSESIGVETGGEL